MSGGRPVPVTRAVLAALLADTLVTALAGETRLRVLVDGAPAAEPGTLAEELVDPLRLRGVDPLRVSADDFLRPAALRFEHGRRDPQAYATGWVDVAALRREVLDPLGPGGTGRWLPRLWDATADRSAREQRSSAPARSVLLLDGWLLADRGLPVDLTVHLRLSPAALNRRTPEAERWTLPAYEDYRPKADVVVLADDPRRPAVLLTS